VQGNNSSFTRPKKGTHPDVDAAVLHFAKKTHAKRMPITWQTMYVKATESTKSLGITNF
jgi:hypothetical protein